MDLPKKERTFTFNHTGSETGITYDGEFTVKSILNIMEKRDLELEKTILAADTKNPTNMLESLCHIIATLRVHIIKAPTWWEQSLGGFNLDDEDVIIALYDKVVEQGNLWREELRNKTQAKAEKAQGNPQKES